MRAKDRRKSSRREPAFVTYCGRRRMLNPSRVPTTPMVTPVVMEKRRVLSRGSGIDVEEVAESFSFRVVPTIPEDSNASESLLI